MSSPDLLSTPVTGGPGRLPPPGWTPSPAPTGLINTAPGVNTTTPGVAPNGSGAPVTGYTPATATATQAQTANYDPSKFVVTPEQTVAGQIKDIIAKGSPLMQQAEATAKQQMNTRGLINSSMAVTAGQDAVYKSALPIATTDAGTHNAAMTNTVNAENTAKQQDAQAKNAAGLQDASLATNTSQYNAGQTNAALSKAADASNTVAITAQQGDIQKSIAQLQANTSLSLQDKQGEIQKLIANIQSNTQLTLQDKQDATNLAIQASQSALQKYLGELQSNTTLTAQQISSEAQKAVATANNISQQQIARIQADTTLTVQQQQNETQKVIAQMNNENARIVQELTNKGALANIQANGEINTKITQMTNDNKTLLQTSSGAASIYSQALTNLSNIMTSDTLSPEQKQTALNNGVQQLNDALSALSTIAGIPAIASTLVFDLPPGPFGAQQPGSHVQGLSPTGGGQGGYYGHSGIINRDGSGGYTDEAGNRYDANNVWIGGPS